MSARTTKVRTAKSKLLPARNCASSTPPLFDIIIEEKTWDKIPNLDGLIHKAGKVVAALLPTQFRFPFSATILLTGNRQIRRLNRDFRGIDKPTNVLSFPQFEPSALPKKGKKTTPIELGDIALAYTYMQKESNKNNILIENHVIHLVIHGLLHLFGYDHLGDDEAQAMERLETRMMQKLGLPDPYAAQSTVRLSRQKVLRRTNSRRSTTRI